MIGGVKTPPYERKVLNVTGYYTGYTITESMYHQRDTQVSLPGFTQESRKTHQPGAH